jgi:hypothetical protein
MAEDKLSLDSIFELTSDISNWSYAPVMGSYNAYEGSSDEFTYVLAYASIPRGSGLFEDVNENGLISKMVEKFPILGPKDAIGIRIYDNNDKSKSIKNIATADKRFMQMFDDITANEEYTHNQFTKTSPRDRR